jgi:hypothetical protein
MVTGDVGNLRLEKDETAARKVEDLRLLGLKTKATRLRVCAELLWQWLM